MSIPIGFKDKENFIWRIADDLRGSFKAHEYGSVILPFVVLRRLECALANSKDKVIAKHKSLEGKIKDLESILCKESGHSFYNTSPLDLEKILKDPNKISENLNSYIHSFSPSAAEVLEKYGFPEKIKRLDDSKLLFHIVGKFSDLDLNENTVSNEAMGYIFEELLRKFSEMSNETAGEHYTPREVIRLMVNLLFLEDEKALSGQKPIRSIYDPACGTGGMLSIAEEYLNQLNPNIVLNVFGQELNDETWAVARSDLMIKGQDPTRITFGNSLTTEDGHQGKQFDYCISNPPYGVDWKKYSDPIQDEHENLGFKGRYGAGLPRVSDGSFLFIQHMVSKMKPFDAHKNEGGSRVAIILSASTLISGQAGSGESEIRRWLIENDLVEGIIALPDQMFYNTEIGTYIWILTNRKADDSKGVVRMVDARDFGTRLPRSLGDKKKTLTDESLIEITRLYGESLKGSKSTNVQILKNEELGFGRITLEKPLRRIWRIDSHSVSNLAIEYREVMANHQGKIFDDETKLVQLLSEIGYDKKQMREIMKTLATSDPHGTITRNKKGEISPDPKLRDYDVIPLPARYIQMSAEERLTSISKIAEDHLISKIHPYISEAWVDHDKTKIGYEIPFTREFFRYQAPRLWTDIRKEISSAEEAVAEIKSSVDLMSNTIFDSSLEIKVSDLQDISAPEGWKCVPLFSLGSRVSEDGYPELEPLSVYLNLGVIPRSSRSDNKNALGSDLGKYQRVINGDLVFNKLRTWQGGFGIAKQEGIVSPAYYIFRFDKESVRPEFIELLLKTPLYLSAITRVTRWMPPSQYDTAWEDIKSIPVWYPSLDVQDSMLKKSDEIRKVQSIIENLVGLQSKFDEYRKSMANYLLLGSMSPKDGKK